MTAFLFMCSFLSIVWWSTLSYFYISWSQGNPRPSQWLWWIMPGTVYCTEYLMWCMKWKMALISQFKTPFPKKKWQVRSNLMFNHNFLTGDFSISRCVEKVVKTTFWWEIQQIFGDYVLPIRFWDCKIVHEYRIISLMHVLVIRLGTHCSSWN